MRWFINTVFFSLLFSVGIPLYAQEQDFTTLKPAEDSLRIYLDSLRASKNDKSRTHWNKVFKTKLKEILEEEEGAFEYPFDSLKTLAKLHSPDKKFRLFNWNVENDMGEHSFYGMILVAGKKEKIIDLNDQSNAITEPESKSLDNRKWYGALYYKIILSNTTGRDEYTLLGWDGNNKTSSKKIIDVLVLAGDKANFGAPVFMEKNKGIKKRVVFEFSSMAKMNLDYDEKEKCIIFDHLSPETPAVEGIREFYYPDGSYDSYRLEEGKWIFESDYDAKLKKKKFKGKFNDPNRPDDY